MEVVLLFVMIIGLLLIGVPIAVSLGLSSILFLLNNSDTSLASVAQRQARSSVDVAQVISLPNSPVQQRLYSF